MVAVSQTALAVDDGLPLFTPETLKRFEQALPAELYAQLRFSIRVVVERVCRPALARATHAAAIGHIKKNLATVGWFRETIIRGTMGAPDAAAALELLLGEMSEATSSSIARDAEKGLPERHWDVLDAALRSTAATNALALRAMALVPDDVDDPQAVLDESFWAIRERSFLAEALLITVATGLDGECRVVRSSVLHSLIGDFERAAIEHYIAVREWLRRVADRFPEPPATYPSPSKSAVEPDTARSVSELFGDDR